MLISIVCNLNSYSLRSFSTISDKMSPEKNEINADNAIKPDTISVGKLGTNPVCKYLKNTGTNNIRDKTNSKTDIIPKKFIGL